MVRAVAGEGFGNADSAGTVRRKVLGAQIRSLRGEMTQTDLGIKVAPYNPDNPGEVIPQTTISRWEKGTVNITLEWAHALESALGCRKGTLAEAAGYISSSITPETVEEMLRSDPQIHPLVKGDLLNMYSFYIKTSKTLAMQDQKIRNREETRPKA